MIADVGLDLDALGRFDEALSWYERSFELNPGLAFNLWATGLHYWLVSGEYGEAVRWLRMAVAADPGDPWNAIELGKLLMDLGDPDQAEHWLHRSIELGPESGIANGGMQLLHLSRGDEASALDYGRKAHALGQ